MNSRIFSTQKTLNRAEVLAPVGSAEHLKAAVRAGADAVYLGTENFNARRNAENFSSFSLKDSVNYCHLYGVKVYVTLNTLIFDYETEELHSAIKEIAKSNADAVIVQDLKTVNAVKKICPSMPLHASTQMAVHNVSGVHFLERLGFTRVVLARELTFDEIKKIVNSTSLETEVFVHGAHCMSVSGNCYISSMLGERSGNRGVCAQPCRLDWKNGNNKNYSLSLKDMSYIQNLKDLESIGVTSLKIEGRMKRPEYVALAVDCAKNSLNDLSFDIQKLKAVFSRNGFTDGYLKNKRDCTMFGHREKQDVVSATNEVLNSIHELYKSERSVFKADFIFTLTKDFSSLTLNSRNKSVTVTGDGGEVPKTQELTFQMCEKNLSKLGNTPYYFNSLKFENNEHLILPLSKINNLRREAVEKLNYQIIFGEHKTFEYENNQKTVKNKKNPAPTLRARFNKFSQYSNDFYDLEYLIFPLKEVRNNKNNLTEIKEKTVIELPDLIYPLQEEKILNELIDLKKDGFKIAISGNPGGIELIKTAGLTPFSSHGLNVLNSDSINFWKNEGVKSLTLSFEMSQNVINKLEDTTNTGIYCYGKLPLMMFRNCPLKTEKGCNNCDGNQFLTDRKNVTFPVICHNKEYSVLQNSVPLYIADKLNVNCDFYTLYFTNESNEECKKILNSVKQKETPNFKKTNGLFLREII